VRGAPAKVQAKRGEQAAEEFAEGRKYRQDRQFSTELAEAHKAMGDPRRAAVEDLGCPANLFQ
jgi:hypothetical protein